jgi:hypothetical protein
VTAEASNKLTSDPAVLAMLGTGPNDRYARQQPPKPHEETVHIGPARVLPELSLSLSGMPSVDSGVGDSVQRAGLERRGAGATSL